MKEKIFDYIDALAAKLGVAAEYVFEVLVRQKFTEGIVQTAIGGLFTALFAILMVYIVKAYMKAEYTVDNRSFYDNKAPKNSYAKFIEIGDGVFAGILCFLVPLAFIGALTATVYGVLSVINPEYYAIKEILAIVGGSK